MPPPPPSFFPRRTEAWAGGEGGREERGGKEAKGGSPFSSLQTDRWLGCNLKVEHVYWYRKCLFFLINKSRAIQK